MTITVQKALDTLAAKGHINKWQRQKVDEYGHTVTNIVVESNTVSVSNETYGEKSFLYFQCLKDGRPSPEITQQVMTTLREVGGNPSGEWNGGLKNGCFEMRVRYFKGSRYWE